MLTGELEKVREVLTATSQSSTQSKLKCKISLTQHTESTTACA